VVATAGTVSASLGAAISRITSTVVGLLIGIAAVALPVSGTLLSGVTVFVALLVLPALSLDAGARLGAATTLIVTAVPGSNAVGDALQRGANVPLGCAVAVAVGIVLLPHRAVLRLDADLRKDVKRAGELARAALLAYLDAASGGGLETQLADLDRASAAHIVALREAAREPGGRGSRLLALQRRVSAVEALVGYVRSLAGVVEESSADRAPALVRSQLRAAGDAFGEATSVFASDGDGFEESLARLDASLQAVDAAFAGARERRATAGLSTDELVRLLLVLRFLHASGSALWRLLPE
jgi:hypothetical protein